MSRWHNFYTDGYFHFCTATVNQWLPKLDDIAAQVLYEEWERARKRFCVRLLAYVIMPEHIHMLLWSENGESIKTFMQQTLSRCSKRLGGGGKLWKERLRVVCVIDPADVKVKLDYIHRNPLRRGLVENPEDWPHSSFGQVVLGLPSRGLQCDPWPEGAVVP